MNREDYEKYYQKGGSYLLPVEVFNEILDSQENLIKYIEDTIEEVKKAKEFANKVMQESSAYESGLIDSYQDLLERIKSGKYE